MRTITHCVLSMLVGIFSILGADTVNAQSSMRTPCSPFPGGELNSVTTGLAFRYSETELIMGQSGPDRYTLILSRPDGKTFTVLRAGVYSGLNAVVSCIIFAGFGLEPDHYPRNLMLPIQTPQLTTAPHGCNTRGHHWQQLARGQYYRTDYGLVKTGSGIKNLLEVYVSENSGWIMLITSPNGNSCIVDSGPRPLIYASRRPLTGHDETTDP
jgi:hypothetical protein